MRFLLTRRPTLARLAFGIVIVALEGTLAHGQLRPDPEALSRAVPELVTSLKADPFNYFRFVNRAWTARVCDIFAAEIARVPMVRLHGDAHVEQFAFTREAWGLDDFDDSVRGPTLVDVVRFLGSIELAARQRGWSRERDRLFDRFFAGYRRGLNEPNYRPPMPAIVGRMRELRTGTDTRAAFLAWGETRMEPMADVPLAAVIAGMERFADLIRRERPELPPEYFRVTRAGWLQMGIGSASLRKVLVRIQGPTADPADDELLEAKAAGHLGAVPCLDVPSQEALRIIAGSQQIGRLKHNILAAGPEMVIPGVTTEGVHLLDWWIRSWDPSYREVRISDLRSPADLAAVVYDSGVQLAAGSFHEETIGTSAARRQALRQVHTLEGRLRTESVNLVEELLRGWEDMKDQ